MSGNAPQIAENGAIWIWDLEARRIAVANDAAVRLWGAESEAELAAWAFGPDHQMTRAATEVAAQLLDRPWAECTLDFSERGLVRLRADRPAYNLVRMVEAIGLAPELRPAPPTDLAEAAFDAAPTALTILDGVGAVVRENEAAKALFGGDAATRWRDRHLAPGAAERGLAEATSRGGAAYAGNLRLSSGRRRALVSLSPFRTGDGDQRMLASSAVAATDELQARRGNDAANFMGACPDPVCVFTQDKGAHIYANPAAERLSPRFAAWGADGPTIDDLFGAEAEAFRNARNTILLDYRRQPQHVALPTPGDPAGARFAARMTLCLWRGEAAVALWISPPRAEGVWADTATPQDTIQRIRRAALLARGSHAMRTAATPIRGYAELLLRMADADASIRDAQLETIIEATDQLTTTLEAFLSEMTDLDE